MDAICIEMVKANRIIRTDQRNLIENIKIKSEGILFNLSKIDNYKKEIQIDGNKGSYRAPKSTAYLILDATEIVYYLTKLLNEKEDFVLECKNNKKKRIKMTMFSPEREIQNDQGDWPDPAAVRRLAVERRFPHPPSPERGSNRTDACGPVSWAAEIPVRPSPPRRQ